MSSLSLVSPCDGDLRAAAVSVHEAFARGVRPVYLDDGTGGVYACRSRLNRFVGIFKPSDEEPAAPCNPKAHGDIVRPGIPVGQMAVRECMAFLADVDHVARVPPTALALAKHDSFNSTRKKLGSFQLYVPHECSAEDVGASVFAVDDVHAIACLDIRLLNQDRHTGNLLVQRRSKDTTTALIPIDHGCCLPELDHLEETTFAWMTWPQARMPLTAATRAYIAALDSFAQEKTMKHLRPPPKALLTLHVGTLFLKKCAAAGLTVADMAQLLVRPVVSMPAPIEGVVGALRHLESHVHMYLRAFEVALDKLLRRVFPPSATAAASSSVVMRGYGSLSAKSYAKVLLSSAA
ncbi:Aste57867_13927 [Aphanomyces stellatus]|uniref:Aste57867_13927 protein n=1 Tax=Aphanomyces stellatus TaxID=120398 RepID=A0A485KZW3_9STRA|nr:hypothetical protein As57867_013876 [Aphanomyces stellatus]VFT90757.1 Aste57867_13927 [Aphanomyces stellatus]